MHVRFKTCLLIDDNYIDNFVSRKILEGSNFADNIIIYQSAHEAITALREGLVKPDIIFLDIRMPQMSGFDFLKEFETLELGNKAAIKIFMLSSSLDPTDMHNSVNNKFVAQFVHKPLTYKALEEISA